MCESGSSGEGVVKDVIQTIHKSGIFADDKGILKNIALVESRYGTHPSTYRSGYYGGIWQVQCIHPKETFLEC